MSYSYFSFFNYNGFLVITRTLSQLIIYIPHYTYYLQ